MISKLIVLLFASGEPVSKKELATLCEVELDEIEKFLPELITYAKEGGLSIIDSKNELQLATGVEHSELVTKFLKKDLEGELTPAALQVLTIIAYLGVISRGDISFIRGVQSAQSIRTLTSRGLVSKTGEMCSLTFEALRFLGVESTSSLPEYEAIHNDLKSKLEEAKREL